VRFDATGDNDIVIYVGAYITTYTK